MSIKMFRRPIQVLGVIFIFMVPFLNKNGITFISGTLYSMAIGPVWVTDPVIGVQAIFAAKHIDLVMILSLVIPIILAVIFGRVFCSWFCPQNTISEIVDGAAKKIGIRRMLPQVISSKLKYAVLGCLLIFTVILSFPVVSLFSAPGILSVQAAKLIYEGTVGAEIMLIGIIIIIELFVSRRLWCSGICPVGAFLSIFRLRHTMKVVFSQEEGAVCGRCYACSDECQLGLNPVAGGFYSQCHNCGQCIDACAAVSAGIKKPLSFKF